MELTDESFDAAIGEGRLFVGFFSPHCGHCKAMMPAWTELDALTEADRKEDVRPMSANGRAFRLASVDVSTEPALASRLDVHGYPTLTVFDRGRMHHYDGERSAEDMMAFASRAFFDKGADVPRRPATWDPVLNAPRLAAEIVEHALRTSALGAALLGCALLSLGALLSRALSGAPSGPAFLTVTCPEGVRPGEGFAVEVGSGLRTRVVRVVAPAGIAPGQTFFVPLVPPPPVRVPPLAKGPAPAPAAARRARSPAPSAGKKRA